MLTEWNFTVQAILFLLAAAVTILSAASYRILKSQYGGRLSAAPPESLTTPIEAVLRMLELTLDTELTATQRAFLETGHSAAQLVKLELFEARSLTVQSPIRH